MLFVLFLPLSFYCSSSSDFQLISFFCSLLFLSVCFPPPCVLLPFFFVVYLFGFLPSSLLFFSYSVFLAGRIGDPYPLTPVYAALCVLLICHCPFLEMVADAGRLRQYDEHDQDGR